MKGQEKLLALAEKLHAENGPVCIYLKKETMTDSLTLSYITLFGERFMLVKESHGIPIALINAPVSDRAPVGLRRLLPEEYSRYAGYIPAKACGAVYPLSIAERTQSGDICTMGENVLFWHKCGFAFIDGAPDKAFLEEVYRRFLSPESETDRRFILFAEDDAVKDFFGEKPDIAIGRRLFFEYGDSTVPEIGELYEGFSLHEIDGSLFDGCTGRITPYFSWDSKEEFLHKGRGFCVVHGERPVAWAFSAAVSGEEIDIGVETLPDYRRLGLAAKAAKAMITYCISENKRPVWACSSENEGSRRLAEKLGFVKTAECFTVAKPGK